MAEDTQSEFNIIKIDAEGLEKGVITKTTFAQSSYLDEEYITKLNQLNDKQKQIIMDLISSLIKNL